MEYADETPSIDEVFEELERTREIAKLMRATRHLAAFIARPVSYYAEKRSHAIDAHDDISRFLVQYCMRGTNDIQSRLGVVVEHAQALSDMNDTALEADDVTREQWAELKGLARVCMEDADAAWREFDNAQFWAGARAAGYRRHFEV